MTDFRPNRMEAMPMVVKNIIIINVIMVLLQFVLGKYGIDLSDYLGLHYWASPKFRWWQIVTHIFMHGDPHDVQGTLMHIGFNMLALWMFGRILENVWGPKRFLIFYMVCGIGAALCYMGVQTWQLHSFASDFAIYKNSGSLDQYILFIKQHHLQGDPTFDSIQQFWAANPDCSDCFEQSRKLLNEYYDEATVGASGAVFGVLFAFGYLFPNTELLLIFPPMPVKAKWVVAVYALIELFSGVRNSPTDHVAHFAHLGGMLFAFILLRIWNKKVRNNFY